MISVELPGLDGRNLLAFLSAVGTQVALDHGAPGSRKEPVHMSWNPETFRPTIKLPEAKEPSVADAKQDSANEGYLLRLLQRGLKKLAEVDEILQWENIKGISRRDFREQTLNPVASEARSGSKRYRADFVAGLATDAAGEEKEVEYTGLCAITGDSQQYFLGCMHELRKRVTDDHL